jgi:GT2 family glycosyltransferase
MSFRRETLLELGGFDENYTNPAYNEDVDLSMRLRAKGYSIMFEPSAHVIHHTYNAGGCENKYIHGKSQEAQVYYRGYWKNYFYFILKNVPNHHCLPLLWHLYRSHVLNLPYLRIGIRYVLAQHWIVACAAWDALKLWRRWRRGTVRAYI